MVERTPEEKQEFENKLFQTYDFIRLNTDVYNLKESYEKMARNIEYLISDVNMLLKEKCILENEISVLKQKMLDLDKYLKIANKIKDIEKDFNND
jgi:hypothetical protein